MPIVWTTIFAIEPVSPYQILIRFSQRYLAAGDSSVLNGALDDSHSGLGWRSLKNLLIGLTCLFGTLYFALHRYGQKFQQLFEAFEAERIPGANVFHPAA